MFLFEVVLVLIILALTPKLVDAVRQGRAPRLDGVGTVLSASSFAVFMALLGIGMGRIVSQLGNVVQSSVDASGRGEAGGLQYTSAQLGSSMGVALIGAIVLAGLSSVFVSTIQVDERIELAVSEQIGLSAGTGIDFVPTGQLESAAQAAGLDAPTTTTTTTTADI